MKQRECALWTEFPLPDHFVLRVLGWVSMYGTFVKRRLEINKHWPVGARNGDVGLRTLVFMLLSEIAETILEIPFAVN